MDSAVLPSSWLRKSLVVSKNYGPKDWGRDYHSFRGNAFGLANTLSQSLLFKPSMESRAANVAFAGHLAHPGPGVPPAMISGLVSANVLDARLAGRDVPLSVDASLSAFLDDAPIASDAAAAGWLSGAVSALLAQSSRVGAAWWALAR